MNPVAVIFDNFGPYHLARLRAAAGTCRLIAIEVAAKSSTYTWASTSHHSDFKRVTLFPQNDGCGVPAPRLATLLERALDEDRPAVVFVPGWASAAAWAAMRWCVGQRVPMVVMSESTAWDEPRSAWKEALKRRLVACFSAALVGGRRHRDYLANLGMAPEQVFEGYDAVDNAYFAKSADTVRARAGGQIDFPSPYFLSGARFVPRKNLLRLLEAYALYRQRCRCAPWSLILLGDGEQRAELEGKRNSLGLCECVQMPGFIQYDELPEYYACAGAFVHASTVEPWGLVVNEAAASGLPLLVSRPCGCTPELVHPGVNGFVFDPKNVEELADQMVDVSGPDFPRASYGEASRRFVADWGVARFADDFSRATTSALAYGPHVPRLSDRSLLNLLLLLRRSAAW